MPTNNSIDLSAAGLAKYNGTGTFSAVTVTQYSPLVGGAANAITSLGPLTNGQLLIGSTGANPVAATITPGAGVSITNGAGSITLASPNFVKLGSLSASASATIDFTSLITSTYKSYLVVLENIKTSAGTILQMLLSSDNGSNWVTSTYQSGDWYMAYNANTITNANTTSSFQIYTGGENTYGASGKIFLYDLGYSAQPHIEGDLFVTQTYWHKCGGIQTTAATYNALRFQFDAAANAITSGNFTLYGISS